MHHHAHLLLGAVLASGLTAAHATPAASALQVTADAPILEIMEEEAFHGKGFLVFPWDDLRRYESSMTLNDVPSLNLWHNAQRVSDMVASVQRLLDDYSQGQEVLYDFYSADERAADPSRELTGLFFFRGQKDAPFAVICPGGGFRYVGSLHEGFPLALELNKRGYNAFVLKYRVNSMGRANEDLIAAVRWIEGHAEELGVDPKGYSLWGGSAGAMMVSNVSYGEGGVRAQDKLDPALAVIAYTVFPGDPFFSAEDSAAYMIVGTEDWIVPYERMEERADKMRKAGVTVKLEVLKDVPHGFGVGRGTKAFGWMERAMDMWQKELEQGR